MRAEGKRFGVDAAYSLGSIRDERMRPSAVKVCSAESLSDKRALAAVRARVLVEVGRIPVMWKGKPGRDSFGIMRLKNETYSLIQYRLERRRPAWVPVGTAA